MFSNPADGFCVDRAPGTVGAARRRRDRRLRAFLKHERMTVAMNMATIQHHSFMKSAVVDVSVQVGSPLAPVTEYVAPAPAVTLSVPCQQLRPAYTTATVATGVNLDVTGKVYPQFSSTAVEVSSSQVVGSLPLGDVFAATVFHQVHQEQLAGSDTTENIAHFPVVQEQVIVHATPRVVDSLPPFAEFTVPAYSPVHQEQFPAGETTENIAEIPVVQEQVIVQAIPRVVGSLPPDGVFTGPVAQVHQEQLSASEMTVDIAEIVIAGMRPEPLAEPRHWFIPGLEALCQDEDGAPSLSLPGLADRAAEVVDSSSLRFLTASALEARRKEEEEREKERKAKENENMMEQSRLELRSLLEVPRDRRSPQQVSRIRSLLQLRADMSSLSPRKKKKRKKKKLPKASSRSSRGRARRRKRQWHPRFAGLPGVVLLLRAGLRCSQSWPFCTRRTAPRSSSTLTVVCAGLVLLVTMHLALCSFLTSPSPRCSASWQVWTRSTVAVAFTWLVLLVIVYLVLRFLLCRQARDAWPHGRFGPGGLFRHVQGFVCLLCLFRETPQLQFLDKVCSHFVVQRQVPAFFRTSLLWRRGSSPWSSSSCSWCSSRTKLLRCPSLSNDRCRSPAVVVLFRSLTPLFLRSGFTVTV